MIEGGWSPATGAPRGPLAGLPAAYARPSTAANAGLGQLLWAKAASLTPAGAKGKKAAAGAAAATETPGAGGGTAPPAAGGGTPATGAAPVAFDFKADWEVYFYGLLYMEFALNQLPFVPDSRKDAHMQWPRGVSNARPSRPRASDMCACLSNCITVHVFHFQFSVRPFSAPAVARTPITAHSRRG